MEATLCDNLASERMESKPRKPPKVTKPRGKLRLWTGRVFKTLGLVFVALVVVALIQGWTAFGKRASGERLKRMKASPNWKDGQFRNPQPLENSYWGMAKGWWNASDHTRPSRPIPVERPSLGAPPASGLRVTWFGHSSMLIELDGQRLLTDPIWSHRPSPLGWIGPTRFYPPPIALDDLPPIDAVLISHDHYDHLDLGTMRRLRQSGALFIVPLGVGAHLAYWGISEGRIVELDWWERTRVGGVEIVATPARHASGRVLIDTDETLWAGYAMLGPDHRVYYSGDTGLFPAMREIGERLGPFDVTMIEAGQYDRAWPDWHIGPEQAVVGHELARGRVMIPVHWALFALAYHGWTEPVERVLAAAARRGVTVLTPRPGQSIEPTVTTAADRWWPDVPWQTAEQHPIRSTKLEEPR